MIQYSLKDISRGVAAMAQVGGKGPENNLQVALLWLREARTLFADRLESQDSSQVDEILKTVMQDIFK